MADLIRSTIQIGLVTSDAVLYRQVEKALHGYEVVGELEQTRVIIADIGSRQLALPPDLPPFVPVIALVPNRTFDMARALFNAGAQDVLVRNVPPGTLRNAVQALLSVEARRPPAPGLLSAELLYLREFSEQASTGDALQPLFDKIVEIVAKLLDVDIVSLMLIERDTEKQRELLRIHAARGLSDQIVRQTVVEVGQGISGLVAAKGEALLVQDVEKAELGILTSRSRYRTKGLLSVPIKTQRQIIGVLNVNNKLQPTTFNDNDLSLLVTLCNQAALAIDNARLFSDLQSQAGRLDDLNQRLVRSNQAKSELIVNLSHELKTPLTTIQGYLDLMRSGDLESEKFGEALTKVHDRSAHLIRLIGRLITYFALDSKLAQFYRQPFPLAVLVWTCVEAVRPDAQSKEVIIETNLEKIDRRANADRQLYREVLIALLENAIKFNHRGGTVRIYGDAVTREGRDLLEVFVEDTGAGIAESLHGEVFDGFKQTEDIMTAKPDGLGLGLAISRMVAEGHGCDLRLVSTGAQGTTFAFTVPLETEK